MIRINLVKKEKKGLTLPDLSKIKEINLKDLLRERAILVVPAIGVVFIIGEIIYAYKLKQEIEAIQLEINKLTMERNRLKKKAKTIMAQRKLLEKEIGVLKTRIKYLEMSKDVILVLKRYYEPFNYSLSFLYRRTPSTVWFDSLLQNMDFQSVSVELSFGSYDINSIKNFYALVKKEFPFLLPGEIKKKENKNGIIFYVSTAQVKKELIGGGE